jgi:hypothetical protein
MQAMGIAPLSPPSIAASRMGALHTLWTQAGLDNIRSREITVTRDFGSFDDFWATTLLQPNIGKPVSDMTPIVQNQLKYACGAAYRSRPTDVCAARPQQMRSGDANPDKGSPHDLFEIIR